MRRIFPLGLLAGTAGALLWAGCAPVEVPQDKTTEADKGPVEVVDVLPAARTEADGPRARLEAAIENVKSRELQTTNSFWTIFHGMVGMGHSTMLTIPQTKERVNALDYICNGGEVRGMRFIVTPNGLDVQTGPAFIGQGHQDQFIAELGQWGMPPDRKFLVNGKEYTYMDFVRHAAKAARTNSNQELTWAIIVIGQYLGTDYSWTNASGEKLKYTDIVRYELDADVLNAACGGTHRLFGLTWARYLHLMDKRHKDEGIWREIYDHTMKYRDLAKQFRNSDGSLSTSFFRGKGNSADKQLRLNSSGHTLEWLALALSDDELREDWIEDAVDAVSKMILEQSNTSIESGTLYHAMHGLLIYHARMYGTKKLGANAPYLLPRPPDPVAKKN
jgi:hypothetical protein